MTDKLLAWRKARAKIMVGLAELGSHPDLDREAREAIFEVGARLHRVRSAKGLKRLGISEVLRAQADRLDIARSKPSTRAAVARLLQKLGR